MNPTVAAYLAHVRPLRPSAQIWRMIVALAIVALGQAVLTVVLFFSVAGLITATTGTPLDRTLSNLAALDSPLAQWITLLTFAGFILGLVIAVRLLHRFPSALLLGLQNRFDWRSFARATAIFSGLGVIAFAGSTVIVDHTTNLPARTWVIWVVPVLAVVLVQVFAEELVFRGYLQSMLAARFASPWIWAVVPTAIFSLLHLPTAASYGGNFWLVLAAPTLLGLIAAHLTVRTGSIAAATGFHFANNLLGILLIAVPGPFGFLSLYTYSIDLADVATVRPMILVNLSLIALTYAIFLPLTPPHTRAKIATGAKRD